MQFDRIISRKWFSFFLLFLPIPLGAQALKGTTGLLHAPTAEMQQGGTFMFGANILALEPLHFMDTDEITHTYNYYINVTFFPWLEVGYTCTLNYAYHGNTYFPEYVWGTYSNQDRSFNVRVRLIEEGKWASWMPSIVFGADDPLSHTRNGGGAITVTDDSMFDNHFTRYYLSATKHFDLSGVGTLGVHGSWCEVYGAGGHGSGGDMSQTIHRPALGISLHLNGLDYRLRFLRGLKLMAEYDALTFNVGFQYSLFHDKLCITFELNDLKYVSAGLYYKVSL